VVRAAGRAGAPAGRASLLAEVQQDRRVVVQRHGAQRAVRRLQQHVLQRTHEASDALYKVLPVDAAQ
jgi:hypothetical protein